MKDINDYVAYVEAEEEALEGERYTPFRDLDENNMPVVAQEYHSTWCEHCGSTFGYLRQHQLGTSGTKPRYCSTECKQGAVLSRKSADQEAINEYLKRVPVREY